MALDASPRPPAELTPLQAPRPEPYREAFPRGARHSAAGLWLGLELLRTVRSLLLLAAVAAVMLLAINFVSTAGQFGQRVTAAWQRTEQGFASAGQAIGDAFNPTHPPRYAISQDTELASLLAVRVGDTLGESQDYRFKLNAIRRRDDAGGNPDVAQYALLDREYKVPRETKLLGITVRVDRGQQQFVLDRGETFRIGSKLYKVNWISAAEQQLAVGVYRSPDQFAGKLAFDSD